MNSLLIDKINDAFIKIMVEENSKGYEKYIKAVNKEFIENIDNLNAEKVREILARNKLNIDNTIILFMIQNAILLILQAPKKAQNNPNLFPIVALAGMYSLSNPDRFVRQMVKIAKGQDLTKREKTANAIYKEFTKDNATIIKDIQKRARERVEWGIVKSKSNKRMIRDFKRGLQEGKSIADIKKGLVAKYNNLSKIDVVLDTELHAQSEFVRNEHSKSIGYGFKIWKTQNDERVRKTCFHNGVKNMKVEIDKDFVSCGLKAAYPGDERLPPHERIRCRCYTIHG
jgi:CxxC motif-containing protein